jgi:LPS-assembly protein
VTKFGRAPRFGLYVLISLTLCLLAHPALSQSGDTLDSPAALASSKSAILVADSVFITPDRELIAEGNVEAFHGASRLQARKITFNREDDKLIIEGPIRIDEGGDITVLADSAELDSALRNGLLVGARMVFDQQLQLAAVQMIRVGGRYSQLYKTAVTSCNICEDGRPPLWQIRARKITHDAKEKQLYFEGAQLRVLDVPVFYFPGMRLPDPSLDRATGFLIPSIRTTSQLATGVKVPYFFRLGDHADLTLSPYVSSKTNTLDFRYRQAFRSGRIEFEGAFTRDDLQPHNDRGYLFGTGEFELRNDYRLEFDIQTASDNAYLADYGLPDLDRLRSEVALSRIKRDTAFRVSYINFESLRDSEVESEVPTGVFDLYYEKRFFPNAIGGEVRLGTLLHSHTRTSRADMLGRDVARATFDASWRRDWRYDNGLRADWLIGVSTEVFDVSDDSTYANRIHRTTPRTALTFSLPMTARDQAGGTHYLEPMVQIGWSNVSGERPPNDESNFVEFDQGNLLSLSRFPAPDAREDGLTLVYGLNWARYAANGWQAFATIGQVFRDTADPQFTKSSGLSGTSSDILLAGQLKLKQGLALTARGLLTGSLNFSKAELRGDWISPRTRVSSTYLWLGTDPAEGRTNAVSELWFDGSYNVNANWRASANLRYDISDARASRAGIGLVYTNECVTVDLSLNRRYTSTTSVEPSTDFGFTISLNGFSVDGGQKSYRRTCRNS